MIAQPRCDIKQAEKKGVAASQSNMHLIGNEADKPKHGKNKIQYFVGLEASFVPFCPTTPPLSSFKLAKCSRTILIVPEWKW